VHKALFNTYSKLVYAAEQYAVAPTLAYLSIFLQSSIVKKKKPKVLPVLRGQGSWLTLTFVFRDEIRACIYYAVLYSMDYNRASVLHQTLLCSVCEA
jgi:hypothetical protein